MNIHGPPTFEMKCNLKKQIASANEKNKPLKWEVYVVSLFNKTKSN
jgi:hypothetical protein